MKIPFRNTITLKIDIHVGGENKIDEANLRRPSIGIMSDTIGFMRRRKRIAARGEQKGEINRKHRSDWAGN